MSLNLLSLILRGNFWGNPRTIAGRVLLATFFSTLGVGAFTFALSLKAEEIGFSASWLGLAFSGYFLARLVLAPVIGYGADSIGPRPFLLTASGAGALVPALYCFDPSAETLGLIQICLGFCTGIIKPVSMALLSRSIPREERGRVFGAYNICLYSAFIAGPLAGGAAAAIQGQIGSLILLMPFLGMIFSFVLYISIHGKSDEGGAAETVSEIAIPWRDTGFIVLLVAVLGRTMGASAVVAFLPRLISEQFAFDAFWAGAVFALPNIMIVLLMPVSGRWADMLDRSGLTFLGMGICAGSLFGLGSVSDIWSLCFLAGLMGLGSAVSLPASMSLASDLGKSKGKVMGLFLGASNLGFVLGPIVAGFAAEFGGVGDAFELTALISAFFLMPMFIQIAGRLNAG